MQKIVVVGLGYVGAPLAVELAKHFDVTGYDINDERIEALSSFVDVTGEIATGELIATTLEYTDRLEVTSDPIVYIITVPTPVTDANVPDLAPVEAATRAVGKVLQPSDLVIYESTVYPGVTEEFCVPILEAESGLDHFEHFNVGYSPERINPGDKVHRLTTTTKIVSGDTLVTLDLVDSIYSKITTTYRAPSIKVAEAAKVIENTQRDVNIALMNELSQIFCRLDIDTNDVIDAAASKWNFQPFRPGLVGGHCISVDPYYLSHRAAQSGLITDVILSAREVNDRMSSFITTELIRLLANERLLGPDLKVTILGCTFKENVPDIRNSKVFAICDLLKTYGITPSVIDPVHGTADPAEPADAVILAVAHDEFAQAGWDLIDQYGKQDQVVVVMDLKGVLDRDTQPDDIVLWRP